MKAAKRIFEIIEDFGCRTYFGVSGGASLHLLGEIRDLKANRLVCVNHEQTVAMATEALSRMSGGLVVGVVTSGPGATNLVTGIAGAFYDSIPCLFLTGQVATFRSSEGLGVRQYGFQETPIAEIMKPVTKLVTEIKSVEDLESQIYLSIREAFNGRPGPVVIDIPDNLQRSEVSKSITARQGYGNEVFDGDDLSSMFTREKLRDYAEKINSFLSKSMKPIVVCGWGLAGAPSSNRELLLQLLDRLEIPVALTWGAKDLVPGDRQYLLGTFGTHGNRNANMAIQNADLLICFGSRLDTKSTGSPERLFAPNAKKLMLDIDPGEYTKFNKKELKIDAFFQIDFRTPNLQFLFNEIRKNSNLEFQESWRKEAVKKIYEKRSIGVDSDYIEPYTFIEDLARITPNQARIVVDTGCSIAWTMQSWVVKKGQRLFHDFNNTAMGWSVPASLASCLVEDDFLTLCLVGDGSIVMSLGELSTLRKYAKRLVVFIINNQGYAMIRQTQDQWFQSDYFGSDSNDIALPNFELIAKASGFVYHKIDGRSEKLSELDLLEMARQVSVVEVFVDPNARVVPQNRFGMPIDKMEPALGELLEE